MPDNGRNSGRSLIAILVVVILLCAAGLGIYGLVRRGRTAPSSAAEAKQIYTCPMHPQIQRPEPGECPICGMDLVPLEDTESSAKSDVAARGVVEISPEKQQLIGVVTAPVERRAVSPAVRAVGLVVVDESRVSDVHTKVEGWVEKLYADETGKIVRRGEPLLTIYSPELVSAQEEYLVALRSRDRVKDSPFEEVSRSGDSLVAAARRRLQLWDISESEIARLEKTGEVRKALTLYAPATGYIMEKSVVQGMRVTPGMVLFRLADLSRVWVEAEIYEYEVPLVREGLEATLTLAAHPGRTFRGKVTYLYPTVDQATRTLRARLEFANPGLTLRPGMYAEVVIRGAAKEELAIPQQAVVDSGKRKVVFVKRDEGTFVPREVTLGAPMGGYYPVLAGLQEGETVVVSPNFLIDSESQFQAALEAMKAGTD